MKILTHCLFLPVVLMHSLLAQESAPVKPAAAAEKPSFEFLGKKFILGEVKRTKGSAQNVYYPPKDNPKAWVQRLNVTLHPGQSDIKKARDLMISFFKKQNHETEVGKLDTPRIVSFFAYEKYPKVHIFNVHTITNGANGKGVVVRTFSSKNLPKNEATFRAAIEKVKEAYLSKLAMAKPPRFILGKPPTSLPDKLPELKTITEKVTDVRDTGKLHTINDAFAEKNGAKPGGHRSFTVAVPMKVEGKVIMQSRPKVKEAVRFTQAITGRLYESTRLTGITIPTGKPMESRLQTAAALMEKQTVPAFFKGYKDAKIGMRYCTKVGPYDGACLLGRFTTDDGTIFYIKFVAILEENNAKGLLAVMLLNPTGDDPLNIKKRMQNGFAQQVLHSIRFVK